MVGISHGSIHAIIKDHLQFRKICAQWVPHQLTEEQKIHRIAVSLGHLQRYHEEEYAFLSSPGTKRGVTILSPRANGKANSGNSPPPKKSKAVHTSSGKVMMTFFFDCKGPLLVNFLEHGATINAKRYKDTLQKLRCAIKSKRPGMLSNGIIFLHDNARPHTSHLVRGTLQGFGWETLNILPTAQIFLHVTFTLLATWRETFVDIGFNRTRTCVTG